jgi:hypothetical protein
MKRGTNIPDTMNEAVVRLEHSKQNIMIAPKNWQVDRSAPIHVHKFVPLAHNRILQVPFIASEFVSGSLFARNRIHIYVL